MAIDIRALRYFVETVRHNSFTQAAEALFVTQSTISKMVRQLEDDIGQPLLIREGKRVHLTDAGRVVFERGQQALSVVRQLNAEVADLAALARGTLTVGLPPMVNLFFSPAVSAFRQRYPGIELRLSEHGGHAIEQQVAGAALEVGATVLPADGALPLATRVIRSHAVWAVGAPDAEWAAPAGSAPATVRLAALRNEPLVLLKDDFSLTRKLRQAFAEIGAEPRIAAQSGHWEFLASMAAAGLGTTFLPEPLIARVPGRERLAVARVAEPAMDWTIALIWAQDRYLSHAARAWLAVCAEVLPQAG